MSSADHFAAFQRVYRARTIQVFSIRIERTTDPLHSVSSESFDVELGIMMIDPPSLFLFHFFKNSIHRYSVPLTLKTAGEKRVKLPLGSGECIRAAGDRGSKLCVAFSGLYSLHIVINSLTTAGFVSGAGSIQLLLRYQRANPMGVWVARGLREPSSPSLL